MEGEPLNIIVTGGAGFIGCNFLRHMVAKYPQHKFTNVDCLTYAGNPANNADLTGKPNYKFVKADITDYDKMKELITPDSIVINFAAESHVDNSLSGDFTFTTTNVLGTHKLLEASRRNKAKLFIQISTDEAYGSLAMNAKSSVETDPVHGTSLYSAAKVAAEQLVMAYANQHGMPVIITRSSNNFGPYQYPEKVIPLFVTNLIEGKKVPVYGKGLNVRDWLYVKDNCEAIDFITFHGKPGEIYNIGGGNEITNMQLTKMILQIMGKDETSIEYVKDRPGHDLRYSLDCKKLHALGWKPRYNFEQAMKETVEWYTNNPKWWEPLKCKKH